MKKAVQTSLLALTLLFVTTSASFGAVSLPRPIVDDEDGYPATLTPSRFQDLRQRMEERQAQIEQRREALQQQIIERVEELRLRRLRLIKSFFDRMVERIRAAITRLELLITRIESRLDKLEAAGEDVADIREELTEAEELLVSAETKLAEAEAEFTGLLESEEPWTAFAKVRELILEVKEILIEVHRMLVAVIGDIKGLRVGTGGE